MAICCVQRTLDITHSIYYIIYSKAEMLLPKKRLTVLDTLTIGTKIFSLSQEQDSPLVARWLLSVE